MAFSTRELSLPAWPVLAGVLAAGCSAFLGRAEPELQEEPPPPEPPPPESALVCDEVDSGLVGFWSDAREQGACALAVRDQRHVGLLLEAEGTFWLSQPGWSIESGEWGRCEERPVELATTESISGEGGGVLDGEVLGIVCSARDLHPAGRRELSLVPCSAPDGSDGPCLSLEGTLLFPAPWRPDFDVEEVRPICNR